MLSRDHAGYRKPEQAVEKESQTMSQTAAEGRRRFSPRIGSAWLWFVLIVVVPTALALIYTLRNESPIYLSETRFAIEESQSGGVGGIDGVMASIGLSSGEPKSIYSLRHYLQSGDAIGQLESTVGFARHYEAPAGDWLTRLHKNPTPDETLSYYRRMVEPRISTTENIITLEVRAFDPQSAHDIAAGLLKQSEEFVNLINTRSLQDQLQFYVAEKDKAEKRLIDARSAVTKWRNQNRLVDPMAEVELVQGIIAELEKQRSETQADMVELEQSLGRERQEARIRTLKLRQEELESQISEARARLADGTRNSSAQKIDIYERLQAEVELAQENLKLSMASVEAARQVMLKQQRYLLTITSPSRPSEPVFPLMMVHVPLTFLLCLILYGIVMLFITIIRDYRSV